jgi:hypothetical protein
MNIQERNNIKYYTVESSQMVIKETRTLVLRLSTIFALAIVIHTASAQQTPTNNATMMANDPATLINQGSALYNAGRHNEAIQYFDKALSINPNDVRALDSKGAALLNAARYKEAIQYFDKALSINPNDTYASTNKNLALSQLGSGITGTPIPPAQQTQQPPVQGQQQQVPQPQLQQQQQQQQQQRQQPPPIIPPHEDLDSFKANGKIDSDIITTSSKWDAIGEWNLVVEDNQLQLFNTTMGWTNATSGHSHEFSGFESEDAIVLPPDNIVSIEGTMEVGTNGATSWEEVPATIDIGGGGKTITISLDHEETDHHFAGQPISGVVSSLTPCSDAPGPSMEVAPSCNLEPIEDPDDADEGDADDGGDEGGDGGGGGEEE